MIFHCSSEAIDWEVLVVREDANFISCESAAV